MAPTVKSALKDTLEDLRKADFEKFCEELVDREGEPRVRRSRVEDKNYLQIADVLVTTFTEAGALQVAVEILTKIDCKKYADKLVKDVGGQSSNPPSSDAAATRAGAAAAGRMAEEMHFVDKHRVELIRRVSNIAAILDDLVDNDVIQQGVYEEINALATSQIKMRALYSGPLKAGTACKDIFFSILQNNEKFLIEDLKKKK